MDYRKDMRWYWIYKEDALDRTVWGNRSGRGYGSVVRKTTERMNDWMNMCETGIIEEPLKQPSRTPGIRGPQYGNRRRKKNSEMEHVTGPNP